MTNPDPTPDNDNPNPKVGIMKTELIALQPRLVVAQQETKKMTAQVLQEKTEVKGLGLGLGLKNISQTNTDIPDALTKSSRPSAMQGGKTSFDLSPEITMRCTADQSVIFRGSDSS